MITAKKAVYKLFGCTHLGDNWYLKEVLREAVSATGATPTGEFAEHHFSPHGYTLTMILQESHAAIHTYPEYDFCFATIFTCGDMNLDAAIDVFENCLNVKEYVVVKEDVSVDKEELEKYAKK